MNLLDLLQRIVLFFAILWCALAAFAGTLLFLDAAARGLSSSGALDPHSAAAQILIAAAACLALLFVFYLGSLLPLWSEKPKEGRR